MEDSRIEWVFPTNVYFWKRKDFWGISQKAYIKLSDRFEDV
jgi:hypothetical protein